MPNDVFGVFVFAKCQMRKKVFVKNALFSIFNSSCLENVTLNLVENNRLPECIQINENMTFYKQMCACHHASHGTIP